MKADQGAADAMRPFGLVLGVAGALLDFYSGYQLLAGPTTMPGEMVTVRGGPSLAWGVGISALGAVLVVTTLAMLLPRGARMMEEFGALMVVYGAAMLFIGLSMYLGATSMMQGAAASGVGMLIVGVLMIVNGARMRRPSMAPM